MIAVVQRVSRGKVSVEGHAVGEIAAGMVALAAVEAGDTDVDVQWMAGKLVGLRIFRSANGDRHFDRDVKEVGGSIMLVSNFTVAAETAKGRRPSLNKAAPPEEGRATFEKLVEAVRGQGVRVETGQFGAAMMVELENDGPVTFIVKSRGDTAQ